MTADERKEVRKQAELVGQLDVVLAYLEEDAPKTAYCIVKIIKARLLEETDLLRGEHHV